MGKNEHIGAFEQLALLAVMRLDDEAYGAKIQEELDRIGGRSAAISTIYITLTRLEAKGMVTSSMGASSEVRGGRPRRYFRIEPAGLIALREARATLLSMWDGLEEQFERITGTTGG